MKHVNSPASSGLQAVYTSLSFGMTGVHEVPRPAFVREGRQLLQICMYVHS